MPSVPAFPEDIFTEPANVDPDTLANLGPLRRLAGEWRSATGVDLNPKADGPERREYIEHILFEPIDPQANGPQLLRAALSHPHHYAGRGHHLPRPGRPLAVGAGDGPGAADAVDPARADGDRVRPGGGGRRQAGADRRARLDRIWNLLDRLSRICVPHRPLPERRE